MPANALNGLLRNIVTVVSSGCLGSLSFFRSGPVSVASDKNGARAASVVQVGRSGPRARASNAKVRGPVSLLLLGVSYIASLWLSNLSISSRDSWPSLFMLVNADYVSAKVSRLSQRS